MNKREERHRRLMKCVDRAGLVIKRCGEIFKKICGTHKFYFSFSYEKIGEEFFVVIFFTIMPFTCLVELVS